MAESPSSQVRDGWDRLVGRGTGGRWVFSKLIARLVPYSATIRPEVQELGPGYARIRMRDRKRVRNHLNSVHAIALANLAELTSGLALTYGLPAEARAILIGLSIDYLKKGRGTLEAECRLEVPDSSVRAEYAFESVVRDEAGDVVVRAVARWLIGPKPADAAPATGARPGSAREPAPAGDGS
ncbi:MAG TPA: hotdog fold domain-containing protein [Longimicrobiales bacterium]|nr:hotdog fold domain-containing protein [Longimicrobiales bacterium]